MATELTSREVRFASEVPADLTDLAGVRDALADALDTCGWDREDAFRVLICADEAMANAQSHGAAGGSDIDVRFRVSVGTAALIVGDHSGHGAEIRDQVPMPDEASEHGRGLILMRAFADTFRTWTRPSGTTVGLKFRPSVGAAR